MHAIDSFEAKETKVRFARLGSLRTEDSVGKLIIIVSNMATLGD